MLTPAEPFSAAPVPPFSEQVTVLPLWVEEGYGIYNADLTHLVKELRAEGIDAAFLHGSAGRRWRVLKGEVPAELVIAIGTSLIGSAAWAAVKVAFERVLGSRREVRARLVVERGDPEGSIERRWFTFEGDADAFIAALDELNRSE